MKYLCKWSNGAGKYLEWDDFEIVAPQFFSDENSYTDEHRFMIEKLTVGDRLDLSDGIGQYHEIERLA